MARSDSTSARMPLPEGTLPVAIGLMVAGLSSFAFFAVGEAALGSEEAFKPVVSMWFATFALAPGCFLPLEQELGRALAARRALRQGGRPVVIKVIALGAILAGVITAVLLAFSSWLAGDYFGDNWVMVVALIISIAAYAPTHLARGICSGSGRFQSYAVVLGADGLVRVLLCVALAVVGVSSVGAFGLAVAVAPLAGVIVVASRGQLRTEPGPEASWSEVTPNLGWLLLGSLMAASLVNAGPIATSLLAGDDEEAFVTRFGQGVILARIPLFLFQAVQAALLPRLSRQAAAGEMAEFRSGFKRLMKLVLAVGIVGTVGSWFLGPFAADLLFGADLTRRTLTILAAGSAFYMLGLAIAQAVIALHGHAQVALGWTIGMVTFALATTLIQGEVFRRVELGLLIGSASAMAVFAWALRTRLRSGAVPSESSMFEAMTDLPLES